MSYAKSLEFMSNMSTPSTKTLFVPTDEWLDHVRSNTNAELFLAYHSSSDVVQNLTCGMCIQMQCGITVFSDLCRTHMLVGPCRVMNVTPFQLQGGVAYYVIENPLPSVDMKTAICPWTMEIAMTGYFLFESVMSCNVYVKDDIAVPLVKCQSQKKGECEILRFDVRDIRDESVTSNSVFCLELRIQGRLALRYEFDVSRTG